MRIGIDESGRTGFDGEMTDAKLEQVLGNFKASADAWSEAAYSRPRTVAVVKHWSWRAAAGWALGCVVVAGSLTGGMHERNLNKEHVRTLAAQRALQQQVAAEQKSTSEDADLLAAVDTDVSQEVPRAMEPLAQLMDEDTIR